MKPFLKTPAGGVAMMALATVCYSLKPIFGRIAMENGLLTEELVTIRLMVALPLFVLTVVALGRVKEMAMPRRELGFLAVVAALFNGGAMVFSFYGIQYLGASVATLVAFVFPTITTLLARLFHKEPITGIKAISLAGAFAGILLVILPLAGEEMAEIMYFDPVKGVAFSLGCAVTWAFTQVSFQQILKKHPPLVTTTWATFFMLVFFLALFGMPSFDLHPKAWTAVILLGTLVWYVPYLLAITAIRVIGASRSAIVQSLQPGMVVVTAWFVLGERLVAMQFVGMALLIAAVLLIKMDAQKGDVARNYSSPGDPEPVRENGVGR